jgi:hypothetical protein
MKVVRIDGKLYRVAEANPAGGKPITFRPGTELAFNLNIGEQRFYFEGKVSQTFNFWGKAKASAPANVMNLVGRVGKSRATAQVILRD